MTPKIDGLIFGECFSVDGKFAISPNMTTWCDKEEFKNRVLEWASKLRVRVRSFAVRPMQNKWAS